MDGRQIKKKEEVENALDSAICALSSIEHALPNNFFFVNRRRKSKLLAE